MPVNVVLALDMSGSVQGARLDQLRAAGERLIQTLAPDDAGAVIAFTEQVTIRSAFTTSKTTLVDALREPNGGSDTALRDATHAALVLGGSRSGRPLVIVFSDGTDTASFLSPELVLDTARRTEPVVYTVTSATGRAGSVSRRRGASDRRPPHRDCVARAAERRVRGNPGRVAGTVSRQLHADWCLQERVARGHRACARPARRGARAAGVSRRAVDDQFNAAMCNVFWVSSGISSRPRLVSTPRSAGETSPPMI